jgi:hypothetical protein
VLRAADDAKVGALRSVTMGEGADGAPGVRFNDIDGEFRGDQIEHPINRTMLALPPPRTAAQLRREPGLVTGGNSAPRIYGSRWFAGTDRNVGRVPQQVADRLRGREFETFDEFRREFWRAVADTPELARQFSPMEVRNMRHRGLAPLVDDSQVSKGKNTFQLHHRTPISQGGAVYDLDNILIVTPRYHDEVLDAAYHTGRSR